MYIPESFRNDNRAELLSFIENRGFATFISISDDLPVASYFPIVLKRSGNEDFIEFHIPKKNELHDLIFNRSPLLVIFNGPDHYISAKWYDSESLPTWDYVTVHLNGVADPLNDSELKDHLKELTDLNESKINPHSPWKLRDDNKELKELFSHITAFRMQITSIQGQWKLSQNQPQNEIKNIISGLEKTPAISSKAEIIDFIKKYSV